MTRSELNCMMVGGFATIAGGVAAVYSGVLKVPAGHLLTASVMSAPAALLIAKVLVPETETSETGAGTQAKTEGDHLNAIDALCAGAADGMKLSLNVLAMLVAFTAVVAAANWLLGSALGIVGLTVAQPLQTGLGYLNAPFAWLMGVAGKDCLAVGQVLGERIVLNEFVGYLSLTGMKDKLDERSFTRDLCALRVREPGLRRHPDRRHQRPCPQPPGRPRPVGLQGHGGRLAGLLPDRLRLRRAALIRLTAVHRDAAGRIPRSAPNAAPPSQVPGPCG